jgi:hypothetical protein
MKKDESGNKKNENAPDAGAQPEAPAGEAEDQGMSQAQCVTWRGTEVRSRIRLAVARWAGVPADDIGSGQLLKQLAPPNDGPWSIAQQNNLIAITNNLDPPVFRSVVPVDDNCQVEAPNELIPGETTVLEWEDIVWRNQRPRTFCRREFGM